MKITAWHWTSTELFYTW